MDLRVQTAKDEMKAFLTVVTEPEEEKIAVKIEQLEQALTEAGVVVGIRKNVLADIVKRKLYNQAITVAVAEEAPPGNDARVEILRKPKRMDEIEPVHQSDGEIDYHAPRDGLVTTCQKGDVLAVRYPPTRGEPGRTVLGNTIPGKNGKEISLDLFQGTNTQINGDQLIASDTGAVRLHKLLVNVEKQFEIRDHIGMNTGSIDLPQDIDIEVIVNGDVQRGFSVSCYALTVSGCIEDSEVHVQKLTVKEGIVGNSELPVIADEIRTGYINGARPVQARNLIVEREVSSGATVAAGVVKAQTIQGCSVYAKDMVFTDYLNGKNTVMVGVDYVQKREYDRLAKLIREIEEPLEELRNASLASAKKMKKLQELAKLNPKHPLLQEELPRIKQIMDKLNTFEAKYSEYKAGQEECQKLMYAESEPLLLVRLGFGKDNSTGQVVEPDSVISLQNYTDKIINQARGGLFSLTKNGIAQTSRFDLKEQHTKLEMLMNPPPPSEEEEQESEEAPAKKEEPRKGLGDSMTKEELLKRREAIKKSRLDKRNGEE